MTKTAPPVAALLFLLACGGTTTRSPEAGAILQEALAARAATGWADFDVVMGPDAPPFPPPEVPCFGHSFHFIGVMRVHQQVIVPANGEVARAVWTATYDPPEFISEEGAPWAVVPGAAHGGVEVYLPDGSVSSFQDKERIPLRNEATGERLTIWGKWHLSRNAAGEVKVANLELACTQP